MDEQTLRERATAAALNAGGIIAFHGLAYIPSANIFLGKKTFRQIVRLVQKRGWDDAWPVLQRAMPKTLGAYRYWQMGRRAANGIMIYFLGKQVYFILRTANSLNGTSKISSKQAAQFDQKHFQREKVIQALLDDQIAAHRDDLKEQGVSFDPEHKVEDREWVDQKKSYLNEIPDSVLQLHQ